MRGADEVTRTFAALARLSRGGAGELVRYGYVNGLPGFVTREAADGDIFVHAAVLRRHGMESLAPGQKVMIRIAEGQKGLQVVEIRAA